VLKDDGGTVNGGQDTSEPQSFTITVQPVADVPSLSINPASGHGGSAIPLGITANLADTDGSESLEVQVSGVPAGAVLSGGTDNGGGKWTLAPKDLAGLTIYIADNPSFDLTVTATARESSNGSAASTTETLRVTVIRNVRIDVRPGSDADPINLASQGIIPVVLFGSATFDVTLVNLLTVRFAGAVVVNSSFTDVDKDGQQDLVLYFRTQETNLRSVYEQFLADDINGDGDLDSNRQQAEVSLTGQTMDGQHFEGFEAVNLFLSGKALRDLLKSMAAGGRI
jgi:hypothetical protein